uniref:Uncharacterized protein n=1 Tax=Geospiza parvula TaxID=87175 RepID=A0A8C3NDV1_GEOPR
ATSTSNRGSSDPAPPGPERAPNGTCPLGPSQIPPKSSKREEEEEEEVEVEVEVGGAETEKAPPSSDQAPPIPSQATPSSSVATPLREPPHRRTRKRPPLEPPQDGVVALCAGCQSLFPGVSLPPQRRCRWLCPDCRAQRRDFNREQRFYKRVGCGTCQACRIPEDCGICSACARSPPGGPSGPGRTPKCLLRRCLRIVKKGLGCGSCAGCLSTEDCGSCCICLRRLQPGLKRQWRCLRRRCLRPKVGLSPRSPPQCHPCHAPPSLAPPCCPLLAARPGVSPTRCPLLTPHPVFPQKARVAKKPQSPRALTEVSAGPPHGAVAQWRPPGVPGEGGTPKCSPHSISALRSGSLSWSGSPAMPPAPGTERRRSRWGGLRTAPGPSRAPPAPLPHQGGNRTPPPPRGETPRLPGTPPGHLGPPRDPPCSPEPSPGAPHRLGPPPQRGPPGAQRRPPEGEWDPKDPLSLLGVPWAPITPLPPPFPAPPGRFGGPDRRHPPREAGAAPAQRVPGAGKGGTLGFGVVPEVWGGPEPLPSPPGAPPTSPCPAGGAG